MNRRGAEDAEEEFGRVGIAHLLWQAVGDAHPTFCSATSARGIRILGSQFR
jgi:hypothetical protein